MDKFNRFYGIEAIGQMLVRGCIAAVDDLKKLLDGFPSKNIMK